MSWELHSKIYVCTDESLPALVERIAALVGGTAHKSGADGPLLEVYVDENDEYDVVRSRTEDDGFLYFPYLVDADASQGIGVFAYRAALNALLQALAQPGVRFVTAADDEPALWNGGRWDGRAVQIAEEPGAR